jgi:hypothetical protein
VDASEKTTMNLSAQSFAEVIAALRRPPANLGIEKRQATRMHVEASVEVSLLSGAREARTVKALTRDISQHGVGLILCESPASGQRLLVHLPRNGRPPLRVLADVRSCQLIADGVYKVGAQFIRELPERDPSPAAGASGAPLSEVDRIRQSILTGGA